MFKTKNILIAIIVIVVIGVGVYFAFSIPETETPEEIPVEEGLPVVPAVETKEFQGIKYKIASKDVEEESATYGVITGELTQEQSQTLIDKLVADIAASDESINEVFLFFYDSESAAAEGNYDMAVSVPIVRE